MASAIIAGQQSNFLSNISVLPYLSLSLSLSMYIIKKKTLQCCIVRRTDVCRGENEKYFFYSRRLSAKLIFSFTKCRPTDVRPERRPTISLSVRDDSERVKMSFVRVRF